METFSYTIQDPIGLHARPAGLLVKKAKELDSKILISCRGKSADLKKLLAVMGLGVRQGDTVTVSVEGENASLHAETLHAFFEDTV